jgi:hypothetical protein
MSSIGGLVGFFETALRCLVKHPKQQEQQKEQQEQQQSKK